MPGSPLPSAPLVGAALLAALLAGLAVPPATAQTAAAQTAAVDAQAQLVAPPGSEQELKATASLPVTALPAAPAQPVRRGELLVAVDVSKLEKELAEVRENLERTQDEKRERTTGLEVTRVGAGGSQPRHVSRPAAGGWRSSSKRRPAPCPS